MADQPSVEASIALREDGKRLIAVYDEGDRKLFKLLDLKLRYGVDLGFFVGAERLEAKMFVIVCVAREDTMLSASQKSLGGRKKEGKGEGQREGEGEEEKRRTYFFKCSRAEVVEAIAKNSGLPFSSHLRQSHTLPLITLPDFSSARKVPCSLIQLVRPLCAFFCIQPWGKKDLFIQTTGGRLARFEVSGDTWFESLSICLAIEMLRSRRKVWVSA